MSARDVNERWGLSSADQAALDAFIESGWKATEGDVRGQRIGALLGRLEPQSFAALSDADRRTLVDVTLARIARATRAATPDVALSGEDAAAVDALLASGWDPEETPARHAARARKIAAALTGLNDPRAADSYDAGAKTALIEATLNRVQREIDRSATLGRIDELEVARLGSRRRFTLADVASIAALLVLTFGVAWPVAAKWREDARLAACAGNMQQSAVGFTQYANDHQGRLPIAAAGFAGGTESGAGPWWNVGEQRSQSANLFTLAREGYLTLRDLTCPGNHVANANLDVHKHTDWRTPDEVSYSYQLPLAPGASVRPLVWSSRLRSVVITDRSPVVGRARRGEAVNPLASSTMHKGRGQNALLSDGSAVFLLSPVLPNGDNIWLPRSLEGRERPTLRGFERPAAPDDAFVGP